MEIAGIKKESLSNGELCGIYVIKNTINSKVYVGQSSNIRHRISQHMYLAISTESTKSHLYNSIRKYGIDKFRWSILELCDRSKLNEKEAYWIKELNSLNREKGYNIKEYDDRLNETMPKETRDKISKALKNLSKSDEHIAKMHTKWSKNHRPTPEMIVKRTESIRARYANGEIDKPNRNPEGIGGFCKKHIPWNKGIKSSKETREKQRLAKLGKKQSKEHVEARSKGRENKIYQFNINGELIKTWDGTRHIERDTNKKYLAQGVRGVCNGSKPFYLDSIFRYEKDIDINNPKVLDEELKIIQQKKQKSINRSKRGSYNNK